LRPDESFSGQGTFQAILRILGEPVSAILPVSGTVSAFRPAADFRIARPAPAGASAGESSSDTQPGWTEQTLQAAFDQARLEEWAERLRASDRASSLLVERPAPDGHRPDYPSAVQAYREVSQLIETL
jgi:hypothetical protein